MANANHPKKKIQRITVKILVPVLLLSFLTAVYLSDPAEAYAFGTEEAVGLSKEGYGTDITEDLSTRQTVDTQGGVKLSVSAGGVVSVENGHTVWRNALPETEAHTGGLTEQAARSPFLITYKYGREKNVTMSSYEESVERGQYRVYVDGKTVVTEYVLGECGGASLPYGIPKARMEEEILPQLSETDQNYLLRRYSFGDKAELSDKMLETIRAVCPRIDTVGFYYLADSGSESKQRRIAQLLAEAGYSEEKYAEDRQITGEIVTPQTEAYRVVVKYRLDGEDLIVTIPFDELRFHPDNPLVTLDIARLTGYAENGENGFYLIPSGNGISVPLGGQSGGSWQYPFYGTDCTKKESELTDGAVPFPVFGMVRDGNGYFAVLEQGAEVSALVMETSPGYSDLYLSLNVLDYGNTSIIKSKTSTVYAQSAYTGDVSVRYHFLSGGEAGYTGMAAYYRQYLTERGVLKPVESSVPEVLVEWTGNVVGARISPLLPIETPICLTTLEQCREACEELTRAGIGQYAVKLSGFNKGGLFAQAPGGYRWETALGPEDGWSRFCRELRDRGCPVYLHTDLGFYYNDRSGDGYSRSRYTSHSINNSYAEIRVLNPANRMPDTRAGVIQVVSPGNFTAFAESYNRTLPDGFGIAIGDSSAHINSDYNTKNYIGRCDSAAMLQKALGILAEKRGVALQSPSAYLLANAELTEIAAETDTYGVMERTAIPFVQIVLHGSLPYACPPINTAADADRSVLHAIETGSIPQYSLVGASDRRVMQTEYSYLYNTDHANWKEFMEQSVLRIRTALEGLTSSRIVGHEIRGDLRKVTYDTGAVIYVNYGDSAAEWDSVSVPAGDYVRVPAEP